MPVLEGEKVPEDVPATVQGEVVKGASDGVEAKQSAGASAGAESAEEEQEPSRLMLVLLCAVSALEGADTALLPAVMFALQKNVGLHFTDLAYLALAQTVCTNIAAPLWGIIADRGCLKRRTILIAGALSQGVITVALGITTGNLGPVVVPMVVLRALEGSALAALRPISNGIIADATSEGRRGKIFGRVQSSLLLGMFISGMIATPLSNQTICGLAGWRVAFCLCGCLALIVACLVALFLVEPPRDESAAGPGRSGFGAVLDELSDLLRFFTIPTFGVMIMQGIFGTIPWSVMGNMTLFFQLTGLSDSQAAILTGEQAVTGAFGNLLGGLVADALARRFGLHGRPLNAQITVSVGLPVIFLIFMGVPPGHGSFVVYFFLIAGFGFLGSWAQSGTNFPILSEIVPASARSRVMAWECALENSIANALGPPVVALLATKCFGYTFGEDEEGEGASIESAVALGKAMTAVICVPWLVCLAAYSLLHWSYPRDVRRLVEQQKAAASEGASPEEVGGKAAEEFEI
mmetsp:Transcript_32073/g.102039  ORF Transcript_32073/g.102039 Transcript_32073/m.102039 type:complete len:521 (-) Transcript_32073:488-2050(-)